MINLLRRIFVQTRPSSTPEVVWGTRPGMVWWLAKARWVNEDETWQPFARTYALIGPVYSTAHIHG